MDVSDAFMSIVHHAIRCQVQDDDDDDEDSYSNESFLSDDDDNSSFEYSNKDDSNDSDDYSKSAEKTFICDYDKIYVCLYDEVEEYRQSKQAKTKNTTHNWNNLLVVLPTGKSANIECAPAMIYKDNKKNKAKEKPKIDNDIKLKPTIKQNGLPPPVKLPEVNGTKTAPKEIKTEKISKKKLKKLKQKEKREKGKLKREAKIKTVNNGEASPEPQDEKLEKETHNEESDTKSKDVKPECEENINNDKVNEEIDEIFENIDEASAFVSSACKKTINKKEEKTVKLPKSVKPQKIAKAAAKPAQINTKKIPVETIIPSTSEIEPSTSGIGPSISKIKPSTSRIGTAASNHIEETIKVPTKTEYQESIVLGKKAIELLLSNKVSEAVQFLSEAIHLNMHDLRHYLNRSFCYLRLLDYHSALKDAQFVIDKTRDTDQLIKAQLRAGQALCGIQNFKEAEKFLYEAYSFSQSDPVVHRELMRVKVLQLVHMGFRERDILKAFYERDSVESVVELLAEENSESNADDDFIDDCGDDDIYNSDDEENPSCVRMLSNLLDYQQSFIKKSSFVSPSPLKISSPIPEEDNFTIFTAIKPQKIITALPPKVAVQKDVNNKAIWVGNTTPEITDAMLRKQFSKFGKIVSVFKMPDKNYSFINFESASAVAALLTNNSAIQFDGHKLPIKAATRSNK